MPEIVDLIGRGQVRPRKLSGGQQQRIALACPLASNPRALLLNGPLGALDLKAPPSQRVMTLSGCRWQPGHSYPIG